MAQRRMFSLAVVDTDAFTDMPVSTQALYFHLGLHGDDDGFVGSPRKIVRSVGCNDDDLRLLASKGYIIPFESGVIVIRDWRVNNTLKNDRYHETVYQAEKALLKVNRAGSYELGTKTETLCFQSGTEPEPERTNELNEQTKGTKVGADKPPTLPRFSPPSLQEVKVYCEERHNSVDPEQFVDFYAAKGWKVGAQSMKDWKAAVRCWERRERKEEDTDGRFDDVLR